MGPIAEEDEEDIRSARTREEQGGEQAEQADGEEDAEQDLADDEEVRKMDELEAQLEAALEAATQELMGRMNSAGEGWSTNDLHSDVRARMAKLGPRMKALDERKR